MRIGEDAMARRDGSTIASSPLIDQTRRGEWQGNPKTSDQYIPPVPTVVLFGLIPAEWWSLWMQKEKASFLKGGRR